MMSDRQQLDPAYILHTRPWRDTSVILDLLSRNQGRYSAVVKGARSEKSRYRGRLQPFAPLLVAVTGRGELKTVTTVDFPGRQRPLAGENLFLGLYVNEILYRLLGRFDPVTPLFDAYSELLEALQGPAAVSAVRGFELRLLAELGYGVNFDYEASDGTLIEPEMYYEYLVHEGFRRTSGSDELVFPGTELLNIARGEFASVDSRRLRYLTRVSLAQLLGGRPLKSRSLFRKQAR